MLIREAKLADALHITEYILLAMEDIVYQFIGVESYEQAFQFIESLVRQQANQYSYKNCWVAEMDDEVVATAVVYDGGQLHTLRKPVAHQIKAYFNLPFNPEDETQSGEYYIDCVGVSLSHQGRGIGSLMFKFLIEEYVVKRKETLGLLVDLDNPNAKKLYLKLGFQVIGPRKLAGKNLEHMQYKTL